MKSRIVIYSVVSKETIKIRDIKKIS